MLMGSALGAEIIWNGVPQVLTPANGGDDVTVEASTLIALGGVGTTISESSIFNRSLEQPGITLLTINSADATRRTLTSVVTQLAGIDGQSLVIAGSADFRPGLLADGGFANVQLVKDGGTGELILDGIFNDLDGALLRVVSGTVSVEGGGGGGSASPISTLWQAIRIDGTGAKLRFGTLDGSTTTFSNGLLINDSGTLEHTATSNDTLTGSVTIQAVKTLNASITAGSLALTGGVAGVAGGSLAKSGAGTLILAGANPYAGSTTVSGGIFAVTGSLASTLITVSPGATFSARPGSGTGYAGNSSTAGSSGLTLSGGAASAASFNMMDDAIGTFRLGTGGLLTQPGLILPTLAFEIGLVLGSIDRLDLSTMGGNASIAPGTRVSFAGLTSATTLALGNYTFLTTAASGLGPAAFTLASSTITVGSTTYSLTLANSTATQGIVTVFGGVSSNSSVIAAAPAGLSFGRVLATAVGTRDITVSRSSGTSNTGATAAVTGGATGATLSATASGSGFITGAQSWVVNVGLTVGLGAHSDTVVISNTGNDGSGSVPGGPGQGNAQIPLNIAVSGNVLGLRTVTSAPLALGRQLATARLSSLTQMVDFDSTGTHAATTDVRVDGTLEFNGASTTLSKSITGQNAVIGASGTYYSAPVVSVETGLGDTYANVLVGYTATPLALRVVTAEPVVLGRQLATTNLNSLTRTLTFQSSGTHEDTTDVIVDGSLMFEGMPGPQDKSITGQNGVIGASGTFYTAPVVSGETGLGDTYGSVAVSYTATPLALRAVSGTAGDLGRVMSGTNLGTLSRSVTFDSTGSHGSVTDVTVDGTLLFNGGSNSQTKLIAGLNAVIGASGTFYSAPVVTGESALGDTYGNVTVGYTATVLQDRVITADTVGFGLVHVGATVGGATTLRTSGDGSSRTAVSVGNAAGGGFSLTGGANPVFSDAAGTDGRTLGATLATAGAFVHATALTLTPGTEAGVSGTQTPVAVVVKYNADVFSGNAFWNGRDGGAWGQTASASWTDTATASIHAAPGTFGSTFAASDTAVFNAASSGTVNLDGATPSLAALTFASGSHTIATGTGAGVLTLRGDGGAATITAGSGNNRVAAPVVLGSNAAVSVTGLLTLSGGLGGAGKTLTKAGAGTLTLAGLQDYAVLIADAGVTNLDSALGTGAATLHANATVHIHTSQTLGALVIGDGAAVTFGEDVNFFVMPEKGGGAVPEPGALALLLAGGLGVLGQRRRR